MKDHKDDGIVNRDGITQGSGFGDTQSKTRDIEDQVKQDDFGRALAGDEKVKDQSAAQTDSPKERP